MSRANVTRIKKLEARRAQFRDPQQMSDDELNRAISEILGISVVAAEQLSDEDLDRLIAEWKDAEERNARAI